MTHAARPTWTTDLATAAATGVVTTMFPSYRWSRQAQWSLHAGFGALAGAATAVGVRSHGRDPGTEPVPPVALVGLALSVGLLTAAVSRGGQGADLWAEQRLAARGVRRPRLWMGVTAAGVSLAMSAAERRRSARTNTTLDGPDAPG